MSELSQVELLFPQGKEVKIGGKARKVMPFGFGKYPKLLRLMKDFKVGDELPADPAKAAEALKKADIGTLMSENADKVIEVCCLALNEKPEFFDSIMPDEGVELVQAIIEVNADFFVRRLQPVILKALSGLSASLGAASSQG